MGDIVGGIIGGIGSIIGSGQAAKHEKQAAQSALTGYNYLNTNPLIGNLQTNAGTASTAQTGALAGAAGTTGAINQLLTSPTQDNPAFKNYLNSTGYGFQLQQGTDAIAGNAAAKGTLNSGSTARALQTYGQGLAGQTFNNYLGQLGGLGAQQLNVASGYGNQVGQGLTAAQAVGQAGTTGGNNAGTFQAQVGQSVGSGITNAFNTVGGGVQNFMGTH